MNNYQSIATINSPEFINLEPLDINPGMAKCEIKVLYLGNNRNGTSINKEAATSMAKTLRGAPIVGYYKDDKGDFFDHGDQVIYDGEGIHFNVLTKPYGFVSPDAEVWFQDFQETDEMGIEITRTYMMTTGYLWVGQYKEAQQVFMDGGKPHSMELDENSLTGFWSKDENSNCEFFIINDAIFSKLCILGDDVEPCFEGSSITAPNVSKNFTLDNNFKTTLYQMMKELQYTLKGGEKTVEEVKKQSIDSSEEIKSTEPEVVETPAQEEAAPAQVEENAQPEAEGQTEGAQDNGSADGASDAGAGAEGGDGASGEYAKKEEDEKDDKSKSEDKEDKKDDGASESKDDKEDDKEKKYALVIQQLEELQTSFAALQEANAKTSEELAHYKKIVEDSESEKKDALIAQFSMLSDEDKKDVIQHKAEYSYDTIKSKLAVICFDKKVSYSAQDDSDSSMTVDIHTSESAMPDWLKAVEDRTNNE